MVTKIQSVTIWSPVRLTESLPERNTNLEVPRHLRFDYRPLKKEYKEVLEASAQTYYARIARQKSLGSRGQV